MRKPPAFIFLIIEGPLELSSSSKPCPNYYVGAGYTNSVSPFCEGRVNLNVGSNKVNISNPNRSSFLHPLTDLHHFFSFLLFLNKIETMDRKVASNLLAMVAYILTKTNKVNII
eukprot:TRINITY_DN628_c0_g3_i2.p1 TRINITY_DN628_c0_g3~~TRINITY_DN628_c0_g3_i2.p1  ORF type:complete len:114 (+),score=10.34 TRINITY_DN628_c0_g3_i2:325-666(+)